MSKSRVDEDEVARDSASATKATPSVNLGFYRHAHEAWTSGGYHEQDLIDTLHGVYKDRVGIRLLLPSGQVLPPDVDTTLHPILSMPTARRWSGEWIQGRLHSRLFQHDILADKFLQQHGIKALIFGRAPEGSTLPTVGLGPDFQERYFPEYFSPAELRRRSDYVREVGETFSRIIVYSRAVRADVARFAPEYLEKVRVVSPISPIPPGVYDCDPQTVCSKFDLAAKFFYIPNQFWQHKNHLLVLKALQLLRKENVRPVVVMSGLTLDSRKVDYFGNFLRTASEYRVRDQIAILGLVPRLDVYLLMRQSIAVINPSLFEGYGMTVSEARWLGKRLLVSEIAAHREQNAPQTQYFDPRDAEMLTAQMREVWDTASPGPDAELEAAAQRDYPARKRAYARDFMSVIQELVPEAREL